MLTQAQNDRIGEETVEYFDDMELEMLEASAEQLSKLEPDNRGEIPWLAIIGGAAALLVAHRGIVNNYMQSVSAPVNRDTYGAFMLNTATELTGAEEAASRLLGETRQLASSTAAILTSTIQGHSQFVVNTANSAYLSAAAQAARQVRAGTNAKIALERAVSGLARQGVTYSTYTRMWNGVPQLVKVPVDVGIRREIRTYVCQELANQIIGIADATGNNLVEVDYSTNPRESHAEWEGQIYQLNGAGEYQNFYIACRWGDPVDGYGGYNCQHNVAIYNGYRHFSDPLKGTGYTREEARELTSMQRHYENEIRKDKREIIARQVVGVSTSSARAKLSHHTRQLNDLVSRHSTILVNQKWRTRIYEQAQIAEGKLGNVAIGKDRARLVYNQAVREMGAEVKAFEENVEKALKPYRQWSERAAQAALNKVSLQKQRRHVQGTQEYRRFGNTQREMLIKQRVEQAKENLKATGAVFDDEAVKVEVEKRLADMKPSYMVLPIEEIQALVDYYAGSGVIGVTRKGTWDKTEYIVADEIVGVVVDTLGRETKTRAFVIKYAKKNLHVQPVLEVK